MKCFWFLFFVLPLCLAPAFALADDPVRIQGAVSVAVPLVEAIKILKNEQSIEVELSVNGGSYGGIAALGAGIADIALSTKPVSAVERADHPNVEFNEIRIGGQAVALTVSRDVWEGGVHALSASQVRDIYEGTTQNWKAVGGPDQKITIFMNSPGRGLWEMFAQWLYGEVRKAPERPYGTVGTPEEVRNAIEFTPGSFSQVAPAFTDNRTLFALAIKDEEGHPIEATPANYRNQTYPLCRDLLMVVNDRPALRVKTLVDFMLGQRGQALVKKAGLVPLADLAPKAH
jgi:phosphate transport system substrate-binding protein